MNKQNDIEAAIETLQAFDLEILAFKTNKKGFMKVVDAWVKLPIEESVQTILSTLEAQRDRGDIACNAMCCVNDEGVFSPDQIGALHNMINTLFPTPETEGE